MMREGERGVGGTRRKNDGGRGEGGGGGTRHLNVHFARHYTRIQRCYAGCKNRIVTAVAY